jgi:hypothetical protein
MTEEHPRRTFGDALEGRSPVEIVVGIPSRNEARTIAQVARTVDRGLASAFPDRAAAIVNADNSSEDGTSQAFLDTPTRAPKVAIDTGDQPSGKGKNVLAILGFAAERGAKAVCLFDADVTSGREDWVGSLAQPVVNTDLPTLVTPIYTKNVYQGNTTNHLIYPYLYAVFGARVEQPIAGEFAMNAAFVREVLREPVCESTLRYGIDTFLTGTALVRGMRVSNVALTKKVHNQWFPKLPYIAQQELDALLRIFVSGRVPEGLAAADDPSDFGKNFVDEVLAEPPDADSVASVCARVADHLLRSQGEGLRERFPSLPPGFTASAAAERPEASSSARPELPAMPSDLWCEVLADGLLNLAPQNFYAVRDDLIALLLCRVLTYWEEIAGRTPAELDAMIQDQAVALRRKLKERRAPLPRFGREAIPFELQPGPWAERMGEEGE